MTKSKLSGKIASQVTSLETLAREKASWSDDNVTPVTQKKRKAS